MAAAYGKLIKQYEAHAFVVRCMMKAGAAPESSRVLADVIVEADSRGIFSHGLNRLGKIIDFTVRDREAKINFL